MGLPLSQGESRSRGRAFASRPFDTSAALRSDETAAVSVLCKGQVGVTELELCPLGPRVGIRIWKLPNVERQGLMSITCKTYMYRHIFHVYITPASIQSSARRRDVVGDQ